VAGNGQPGTPWVVSGAVIISDDADNLLTVAPDGLKVDCDAVQECVPDTQVTVADTPTLDASISGNGLPGTPFVISGDVKVSADVGNQIIVEPDGLFVPESDPTVVQAVDTNTIDQTVTGTGTPGDPYLVSGQVKISPTTQGNLLTTQPDGLALTCESVQDCIGEAVAAGNGLEYDDAGNALSADISGDVGNILAFGGDGGLFVPPDMPNTVVTVQDTATPTCSATRSRSTAGRGTFSVSRSVGSASTARPCRTVSIRPR
jgi:hypothetical protein